MATVQIPNSSVSITDLIEYVHDHVHDHANSDGHMLITNETAIQRVRQFRDIIEVMCSCSTHGENYKKASVFFGPNYSFRYSNIYKEIIRIVQENRFQSTYHYAELWFVNLKQIWSKDDDDMCTKCTVMNDFIDVLVDLIQCFGLGQRRTIFDKMFWENGRIPIDSTHTLNTYFRFGNPILIKNHDSQGVNSIIECTWENIKIHIDVLDVSSEIIKEK